MAGAGVSARTASGAASAGGGVGQIVAAPLEPLYRRGVVGVAARSETACVVGGRLGRAGSRGSRVSCGRGLAAV